ncbi:MAG: DoxX family protein [Myxococcales bacterium]
MAEQFDQGRFETRAEDTDDARIVEEQPRVLTQEPLIEREPIQRTVVVEEDGRVRARTFFGDLMYTALRVTVGTVFLGHGLLKLQDMTAWADKVRELGVPSPATMALLSMAAELGGGIALILGLFTRFVSCAIAINMAVAILMVHAGKGLFAQNGGMEYPLTLFMTSLLFLAEGSRRYGVDARFWQALRERREHGRPLHPRYVH